MTQEENQYYLALKKNASLNQYVFDKLFSIINGHVVAKPNVVLQLIGSIPMVTNSFEDTNVFASLFPQGLSAPSFENNVFNGNLALKKRNPFSYSPLSKNGNDVRDNFFGGSTIYSYANIQIIVDPTSGSKPKDKIKIIENCFYEDTNNSGIYGDSRDGIADKYLFTIKVFVSQIKQELQDIYQDPTVIPADDEILLFLENNNGDWSGSTMYAKKGKNITEKIFKSITRTSYNENDLGYINELEIKYNISQTDLIEFINTGEIKNKFLEIFSFLFEFSSLFISNPILLKGVAKAIDTAIIFIKDNCLIEEIHWNPYKSQQFNPILLPGITNQLDNIDDKNINNYLNEAIKNLKEKVNQYDEIIEDTIKSISRIPIISLMPLATNISLNDPFSKLLLEKYYNLKIIFYKMLDESENLDFSESIKEGIYVINAFLCGIWNGFIEAISGIISLIKYLFEGAGEITDLLKNFKTKSPEVLEAIDDITTAFRNLDFGKVFDKLITSIKKWVSANNTVSSIEIAYFSGAFIGFVIELAVEIVAGILLTGGVLSVEAVLAKIAEVFKALFSLIYGAIKLPVAVAGKTLNGFIKALKWLAELLAKGTDEFLRIIDEVFAKLKVLGEEFVRAIIKERGLDKPFFSKVTEIVSKGIVYGQSKYYTCAATSLRMVLESKGVQYSEEYLARALGTTEDGARILDIPDALYAIRQETNLLTKAYREIKLDKLVELLKNGDTAIVSVFEKGKGSHAIIIDAIENGKVIIRDPLPINSGSSYSIDILEFKKFFSEKAIIVKK